MPPDLPPSPRRTRWRLLAVLALAATGVAAALLWSASSSGFIRPGDVLWFHVPPKEKLVHRPRWAGWTSDLCEATDGSPCGFQVVGLIYNPDVGGAVEVVPRMTWLQRTFARCGLGGGGPPLPLELRILDEVQTASGRWMACTLDVATLPGDWQPADLVGTWLHEGAGTDQREPLAFLADGRVVEVAPPGDDRGRWAARNGHLFLRWLRYPSPMYGDFTEVFRLSDDRRSYTQRYVWAPSVGGRRE